MVPPTPARTRRQKVANTTPIISSAPGTPANTSSIRRSARLATKTQDVSTANDPCTATSEAYETEVALKKTKKSKNLPLRSRDSPTSTDLKISIPQGSITPSRSRRKGRSTMEAETEITNPQEGTEESNMEVQGISKVPEEESTMNHTIAMHEPVPGSIKDNLTKYDKDNTFSDDEQNGVAIAARSTKPSRRKSSHESPQEPVISTVITANSPPSASQMKAKIIFDDNYDFAAAVKKAKAAAPVQPAMLSSAEADDEEVNTDDEAPEDEDVKQAPSKVDLAMKTALRTAEEQFAEQKRKRQERDALFKKQAEQRRAIQEASVAAAANAVPDLMEVNSTDDLALPISSTAPLAGRKRHVRSDVPDILPDEFLASDSDHEEDGSDDTAAVARRNGWRPAKRARKITFEQVDKEVDRAARKQNKDLRVGDTVFRINGKVGEKALAPPRVSGPNSTASLSAVKRDLLLRKRPHAVPVGKKKGAFFKKIM